VQACSIKKTSLGYEKGLKSSLIFLEKKHSHNEDFEILTTLSITTFMIPNLSPIPKQTTPVFMIMAPSSSPVCLEKGLLRFEHTPARGKDFNRLNFKVVDSRG